MNETQIKLLFPSLIRGRDQKPWSSEGSNVRVWEIPEFMGKHDQENSTFLQNCARSRWCNQCETIVTHGAVLCSINNSDKHPGTCSRLLEYQSIKAKYLMSDGASQ